MGDEIVVKLENGNKAIVREIAREVIKEQRESCLMGNENRTRIIALEHADAAFKETTDKIFNKLDTTATAHDKQWKSVYNAVIGLLCGVVGFFLIYLFKVIFK